MKIQITVTINAHYIDREPEDHKPGSKIERQVCKTVEAALEDLANQLLDFDYDVEDTKTGQVEVTALQCSLATRLPDDPTEVES